jgi:DNA helicase HerA-like ATPase
MNRPVHFARALAPASDDPVSLGRLEFWGRVSRSEVRLPLREFSQHTLVAGTTGAGKTSTVKQILYQLQQRPQPIPFLVLEPAKDEYLDLFETLRREGKNPLRLTVGGRPSDDGCEGPLRFNPLAIPNGLVAGQHVEQIKILLRASFSMQESLPQILEAVIAETYAEKRFGIDSVAMGKPYTGELPLPTLRDLVTRTDDSTTAIVINKVVTRLGYEDRIAQNLIAAIRVRLESFGIGLKRDLFMGGDMDFGDALSRPTFINISGLPEPDVRRFLAASLFVRLYGERIAEKARRAGVAAADGPGIRHMLVLEEAHHFMRRAVGHGPSVELMRETNAILANAFAELRSFGQAILVADQGPGELDEAVLRNTNTKICHRLFYEADCVAMADSMGLDEEQRGALRRLLPGHAAVFSPSLRQAVATRVTEWKASSLWGPASAPR